MTSIATRATEEIEGLKPAEGAADQEHLRPRPDLVDVRAPDRVDDLLAGDEIRQAAGDPRRPTSPPSKPATTSARRPRSRRPRSKSSRRRSTPGEYRNIDGTQALALGLIAASVKQRPAAVLRQLSDHPGLRAAPPPRPPRPLRRPHRAGRGRDRRRQHGARRRLRRQARGHRDQRPGDGPEGGDDRAGGDARAADGDRRRAARRPLDRDADQNRADRPADGDPRPPRRVAAAGDRAPRPRPTASTTAVEAVRDRGPLPDAGDPARRHLPRQLLRALADPRQRRPAGDRPRLRRRARTPATSSCPTCATSAAPGPGRSPARPASSTGSAASRRRTAAATSATTRPTTR